MIEVPLSCCGENLFALYSCCLPYPWPPTPGALPPGPTAFVLIARLHALPGQADQMIALPGAVDETLEAGEPGMLLHTFDRDPGDSQGFIWTEVYEDSEALIFHLNNLDLGAYLAAVSPLLDEFTVELYGAVTGDAVAALRATGTPTTQYPNMLGYVRDLTP